MMASFDDIFDEASKDRATYAIFCCLRLVLLNDYFVCHSNIIMNHIINMTTQEEYEKFLTVLKYAHQQKVMDLSDILPFINNELL